MFFGLFLFTANADLAVVKNKKSTESIGSIESSDEQPCSFSDGGLTRKEI